MTANWSLLMWLLTLIHSVFQRYFTELIQGLKIVESMNYCWQ